MAIRVLIIDDLTFMREAIRDILESNGITVAGEAENGRLGVHAYLRSKPDVVLMDITMPVLDGIGALKLIKKADSKAVVVMCSALGQQEYIIRSIQLGARDFIIKPFKPERILSAIRKAARVYE